MPGLPPEMLRRLYEQGSLRNTEDGFEVTLLNTLAPGTLIGMGPIVVDGRAIPAERITVFAGRSERPAQRVNEQGPVPFPVNGRIRLRIADTSLAPGWHTLVIHVQLKEVGPLHIEVEDQVTLDATEQASERPLT